MPLSRELIKGSCLQVKTVRWTGTLRRKKKPLYEPNHWVALCVHRNTNPCLEWYENEEHYEQHCPIKVLDLLYTKYVNLVQEEPRLFVIGFTEGDPLELASESPRDTLNWVEKLFTTLKRLSTQSVSTNFFQNGNVTSDYAYIDLPLRTRPMAIPPATERPVSHRSSLSESSVSFRMPEPARHSIRLPDPSERPPLPYRPPYTPLTLPFNPNVSRRGSVQEFPNGGCLSPGDEPSVTPHILSPLYDNPRPDSVSSVIMEQGRSMNAVENGQTNGSPAKNKGKDLSPTNYSSSPLESTISSTTSLCSSLSSELRLSTPAAEYSDYNYPREQVPYHGPVKYVSLNLSIIVEHILFVEMKGRIWVAGWSEPQDKQLSGILTFGDELIEVEGTPIKASDIPQIFYNVSVCGAPISLAFRPTPFGKTFTLMKPVRKDKDIGIRLHKHKNRISEIITDSSADRRGLEPLMASAFHGIHQSSAVITDVAGRRLNPFARNDQFFLRYVEVPEGTSFSLTIHPHDFMKEMKMQLQHKDAKKNYKAFLALV